MKLIVGLGNPGKEYQNTRHNIGYYVLDNYLTGAKWKKEKTADIIKKENILFIKPTTFMNLSGAAVKYYANFYKINPSDILVIQDDLDSNLGTIKIKYSSSSGGHNGIKDIISALNTEDFTRLKIGISHPKDNVIDYVLNKFTKDEQTKIDEIIPITKCIIDDFIAGKPIEILQNKYNQRN